MQVDAPKLLENHPDRGLQCQESNAPVMAEITTDANAKGCETVEAMNEMEEVLRNLLRAYEEDPDPEEDPDERPASE